MKTKSHLSETENKIRMNLYDEGFSDKQIAKERGISSQAIQLWRKRRNIPSNYEVINTRTGEKISYVYK